jgi:hypothetical protein
MRAASVALGAQASHGALNDDDHENAPTRYRRYTDVIPNAVFRLEPMP